MPAKWTDPAPKYGPTAEYGDCEADGCTAVARRTCSECSAHTCLGHADHAEHAHLVEHHGESLSRPSHRN